MAQKQESKLQKKIKDWLNDQPQCVCWKMHGGPHMPKGLVDLIGCWKGRYFALEVKVEGKENTLTEIQAANLEKIKAAGGITGVVTSIEDVKEVFSNYVREKKAKRSS